MKPLFGRRSISGTEIAPETGNQRAGNSVPPGSGQIYACCCPAKPIVRVIMPPSPTRPHSVDLLLCGHHYRVSQAKLEAHGAVVEELPGHAADVAAALFQYVSEPETEVASSPAS